MKRYLLPGLLLIVALCLWGQQIPLPMLWNDISYLGSGAAVIQGDLLYSTSPYNAEFTGPGTDLTILDLSDSQRFTTLSSLDLDAPNTSGLAVHADRAIVIHTDAQLSAIDISDPTQPQFITTVMNPAAIVAQESYGHYLYVYDSLGDMRCYAMEGLELMASRWIGTDYTAMTIEDGRAYLSGSMPGFRCLGVGQPSVIYEMGILGDASNQQIKASESGILISWEQPGALRFYDVSALGGCNLILTWSSPYADFIRIATTGGLLAVHTQTEYSDYTESSLNFFDLDAVGGPEIIYTDSNPGSLNWLCISQDFLLHRYEDNSSGDTYSLYGITDPSQPQLLGKLLTGGVTHLATNSNRLFANVGQQGLNIYGLSEPDPVLQSRLPEPSISFVAANEQNLLINRYWNWGPGLPTSNAVYIYTLQGNGEYLPVNYSGGCSLGEPINDFLYKDNRLYMCGMGGLMIYDLTDISHPLELAFLPGNLSSLETHDDYLYLAGHDTSFKLWIYDISTPSSPQLLSWLPINNPGFGTLRYHNNALFVGGQPMVVDVSDPSSPVSLYQYGPILGTASEISLSDNALIVMRWNDLRVFDISSVSNPQLVSSTSFEVSAHCMAVKDSLAYIGHKEGLSCYDLRESLAYCATLDTQIETISAVPRLSVFPNPIHDSSTMKLELAEAGSYSICIYNIKGQLVKRFPSRTCLAGSNTLTWTGQDDQGNKLPSGIYLLRASSPTRTIQAKVMLLK